MLESHHFTTYQSHFGNPRLGALYVEMKALRIIQYSILTPTRPFFNMAEGSYKALTQELEALEKELASARVSTSEKEAELALLKAKVSEIFLLDDSKWEKLCKMCDDVHEANVSLPVNILSFTNAAQDERVKETEMLVRELMEGAGKIDRTRRFIMQFIKPVHDQNKMVRELKIEKYVKIYKLPKSIDVSELENMPAWTFGGSVTNEDGKQD